MKILAAIGAMAVVLSVGGVLFVSSGAYNVAADAPHWPLTETILHAVRERSIESRSNDIEVPADLDSRERVAKGARQYAEMCAGCHLAPGVADTEMRAGLYPQPPDLVQQKTENPQEAFWIIKHGVKMSAMPAWGRTHDDRVIWDMVAFLRGLPAMTPVQYRKLTAGAKPGGHELHHAGSHTHAHP